MRAFLSLFLILLSAGFLAAEPVPLFDGTSLAGWEGNEKVWRVEDGTLTGGSMEGNPRNEFLATERVFKNFRLSLDYKLIGSEGFVNGGVQIRSHRLTDPAHEMAGYQADIGGGYSGFLYDESRRKRMLATAEVEKIEEIEKPGEWNHFSILAEGKRVRIFLNGVETIDYIEMDSGIGESGHLALQIHGDCKAVISYKNIMIEELPADLAPSPPEILRRFGDPEGKSTRESSETIVFVGQENLVRAQKTGFLESALLAQSGDPLPRVRFMAWEGDTVYKQWRNINFGSWKDQLETAGATAVFAQFGQTESFDGPEAIPAFIAAYRQFLEQLSNNGTRLVLLSPTPFENPGGDLPDLSQRNETLGKYVNAVRDLASESHLPFIDLFHPLTERPVDSPPLTDDGWHLNRAGLKTVAVEFEKGIVEKAQALDPSPELLAALVEKNRLFAAAWRPANWSFVYGDRVEQKFASAPPDTPNLRENFEAHKPLIAEWEARISLLARGEEPAPPEAAPTYPATEQMMTVEEELATFTPAEGYQINLFAGEDLGVQKPIQFVWDEEGRLWVACSPTYPHLFPGQKPRDFILVLEDTDGDGRADKSHRFAEGLTMVQGLELGGGGLYVCDFDRLILLTDRDDDGKADQEETILAGFGIGDTHQLINSLTYGPAGNLWFSQGLHAFSRTETPHGLVELEKAGIWRFNPRTRKLDPFFNGGMAGHNCWGIAFDDYGQVFHKSGDRPHGYWSVPGLTANPHPAQYHDIGKLFETFPKTTGLEFVGTAALPQDLQGAALIGGYMGNLLEAHRLEDAGSGFKSTQLPRLLTSTTESFRPVDVSVGPDGAIYLADWFNPLIGHYQTSYADPLRDRSHGRIWRLSSKTLPPVKQPDLAKMDAKELLKQLKSPERWTRTQAKRLLFNMPSDDVLAPLAAATFAEFEDGAPETKILIDLAGIFQAHLSSNPQHPSAAALALWKRLMESKDFRLRAYSLRLLVNWPSNQGFPGEIYCSAITDPHPRVRLETLVALSECGSEAPRASALDSTQPPTEAAEEVQSDSSVKLRSHTPKNPIAIALCVLDSEMDPFLDYALAETAQALRPQWEPLLADGKLELPEKHRAYLQKMAAQRDAAPDPGEEIYQTLCLNCHQPGGTGLVGIYPPLRNSEWLQGDPDRAVKILLHGLEGPITVGDVDYGKKAPLPMPPMGLTDQQIADVLTYLRAPAFENPNEPVTPEEVEKIRSVSSSRTTPWTAAELRP